MDLNIRLISMLLLILMSISSHSFASQFNHSIGPLALCDLEFSDSRQYTENCYKRCNRAKDPAEGVFVKLYQDEASSGGPLVYHCRKVILKQTFTETWTFSRIAGPLILVADSTTLEECQSIKKNNCPGNSSCGLYLPSSLPEEYHYASDTDVVKSYIELFSSPSGLDYLNGDLKITPAGTKASFDFSIGHGEHKESIYFWSTGKFPNSCPFQPAQEIGCDRYNSDPEIFRCRTSRFYIESLGSQGNLGGHCEGILRSTSGLLYSWSKTKGFLPNQKRIYISPETDSKNEILSLRAQTANGFSVLDEEICLSQCEMMNLEMRTGRNSEILIRLGGQYALITKTNYIRPCHPLTGCRLLKPHTFCGSPNRIMITCHGRVYSWDPKKSHVEVGQSCSNPERGSNLTITLGFKDYIINDDLLIELPEKDSFGLPHDQIAVDNDNILKEIIDPSALRISWKTASESPPQPNKPISQNHTINTWDGIDVTAPFSLFVTKIGEVYDRLWKVVMITGLIIAAVTGAKVLKFFPSVKKHEYAPTARQNREEPIWT